MLKWQKVISSNLDQVGYNAEKLELHIKFRSGTEYIYRAVPVTVFDGLMNAPSKGKFHAQHIKNKFKFTKI
jgi:hypothetical protein